ncbi:protease adaptor protein RcdA [soil metagenome]
MSMTDLTASDDHTAPEGQLPGLRVQSRAAEVHDFARSELFGRTFQEGMELVEDVATYLDGDGRRESKLLSRAAALAYAGESMRLTTRLMQVASWLLVQRAVREGDMAPEAACEPRYRMNERRVETEPSHADLPIALIEYVLRADKLHDRVQYLDRRMYLDTPSGIDAVNPVLSQHGLLEAAFRL